MSNFACIYCPVGNWHLVVDRPALHQSIFRKKLLLTSLVADFGGYKLQRQPELEEVYIARM